MLFKRIEVAVTVQQPMSTDNAPSCQHDVDGSANSHAQTSGLPIVLCRFDNYIFTTQRNELKAPE